jgi:uncharacterized repeat protein (TIGR03803 family)
MSTANRQHSWHLFARHPQHTQCRMSATHWLFLIKALLSGCPRLSVLGTLWLAITITPMALPAQTYTDLHDFDCTVEGCIPFIGHLMAQGRDGNLYGTLQTGGTSNMGTVFKATPSGTMTTLHNFSGADGENPRGGLTLGTDGNFYGTTSLGGVNNLGTVFKITPSGVLTTLHSFDGSDGSGPYGGLVQGKNGSFYGTTCGFNPPWTAFSITSTGKFTTLTTGIPPCSFGNLFLGNDGNFYGTGNDGGPYGLGAVFRMTPGGAVTILYSFDGAHGQYPNSLVVQSNDGFLYGTTRAGGAGQYGVVYKLSPSGRLTLLHEFGLDPNDGIWLDAGLVAASDGNFYGTTTYGFDPGPTPNGTLFEISSTGKTYSPLHLFADITHGAFPESTPMQHTNGKIYGLTQEGSVPKNDGVFYCLDNGLPPFVSLLTRWGSSGQKVAILGNGFTGTTSVNFGSGSASFTVVSDTYMTANVPDDGAVGLVTVTTPTGTLTSSRPFNVIPGVKSFAPPSGPVGTQVTVTGSGFTGATKVTFGGAKAPTYTVNSGTQITATVPSGAKTGNITVTTAGGSASSKSTFTVTP